MAIPTDELSILIRDWYYAASEGQAETFIGFFLQDGLLPELHNVTVLLCLWILFA